MQVMYLYGFASGPLSEKAQYFKQKFSFTSIDFQIIDYIPNSEAFTQMKPSRLVKFIENYIKVHHSSDEELVLLGSSFGGLIASWYTQLNPKTVSKLILIAPALNFTPKYISHILDTNAYKWEKTGSVYVDHYRYGKHIPLNYSFLQDLQSYPPPVFQDESLPVPTCIFHGIKDDVIPIKWSLDLASQNSLISIYPINGDHQLLDRKEEIWNNIIEFLQK
ncbi:MAG: YqiA/YcfP family alpha/beta fold hydrolase [Candidatus Hodarchaeales archaeon]|jgi:alpha-beta hydrolase superfamily lysophospholipase